MTRFGDGRDWFFEKRLGLFLHWGLYAVPGWHEQHQFRLGLARREYEPLLREFNPAPFDPDTWLDLAGEAGMEYVCFTTKHIDGFCLWNTAQTDYNVMHTPYGKDVLGMLAEACHRRGVPLCLYYSCADMHHPNYPNAGRNYELPGPEPGDEPDLDRYLAFVRAQVRELCTNYGEIHGFWWDANMPEHRDPSFNAMIRALQPKAVINNRGYDEGDTTTPEREWSRDTIRGALRFERPTEACNSVGVQSWGYRRDEDYYSLHHLIDSIDTVLVRGGNYLLNAGPDAQGAIPDRPAAILRRIGRWYQKVREAFDGAEPASELAGAAAGGLYLTRKGATLYVHLCGAPTADAVVLPFVRALPRRAILLNTGDPVQTSTDLLPQFFRGKERFLRLCRLPVDAMANEVMVVRLDFDTPCW